MNSISLSSLSNNLHCVTFTSDDKELYLYFSYSTIVACLTIDYKGNRSLVITDKKYSVTTSKHVNYIKNREIHFQEGQNILEKTVINFLSTMKL